MPKLVLILVSVSLIIPQSASNNLPSYELSDSEEDGIYSTIVNNQRINESNLLFVLDRTSDSPRAEDLLEAYHQDSVATHLNEQDLTRFFNNTKGAFSLYDLKNNRYIRYNEARCRERFSPKSTFKIPNSLIGLETGVIRDADFVIPWNRRKHPPQDNWNQEPFNHWAQDQTLRSAIKYSVVWYFQELALRVGEQRMKKYVTAFNYGNQNVSGGIDEFWLNGKLQISTDEEVEFLKAFYAERLPISKRSIEIVKDILILEKTPAFTLSGKTGGGSVAEGKYIGWFVGYLETDGNVYFFATNIEGSNFPEIREKRIDVTKQILMHLGYLPK